MTAQIQHVLISILALVLTIALPYLVKYFGDHATATQKASLASFAKTAVAAAEQLQAAGVIPDSAGKKAYAFKALQAEFPGADTAKLETLIEAGVNDLGLAQAAITPAPTAPATPWPPKPSRA